MVHKHKPEQFRKHHHFFRKEEIKAELNQTCQQKRAWVDNIVPAVRINPAIEEKTEEKAA